MQYNSLISAAMNSRRSAYAPYSRFAVAIAQGEKDFEAIAITTDSKEPALPCGACRQVLAEFSQTLKAIAVTTGGKQQQLSLAELLPSPKQGLFEDVLPSD